MTEHVNDSLIIWRAYCEKKEELEDAQDRIEILERNLERMLLEFDFLIEDGYIRDCRNDVIFVEAREALGKKS